MLLYQGKGQGEEFVWFCQYSYSSIGIGVQRVGYSGSNYETDRE